MIFELAQRDATPVAELRRELRLDAGYLSRITARLESDGLVTRRRDDGDGRRQVLGLTERGREVFATLDARSAEQVAGLLSGLDDAAQREVVAAMDTIRAALGGMEAARRPVRAVILRPPGPGDLGWVISRHGALYAAEYGWDATFEGLVASILGDFAAGHDPAREAAWIAEVDGERAAASSAWPGTDHRPAAAPAGRAVRPRPRHRRPAGRRVPALRPPRRLPVHRAVDQRRACLGPADLRGRRLPAGGGGAAPQLRRRPRRPDLVPRPLRLPGRRPPAGRAARWAAIPRFSVTTSGRGEAGGSHRVRPSPPPERPRGEKCAA